LRLSRRIFERSVNLHLGFFLQIDSLRQGVSIEALIVILRQCLRVSHEPGFHALRHQMHLLFSRGIEVPVIALLKMGAWQGCYRRFRRKK